MSIGVAGSLKRRGFPESRVSKPLSSSTREICLLGREGRELPPDWHPGACVAWQGRYYQIDGQDSLYVHLTVAAGPLKV